MFVFPWQDSTVDDTQENDIFSNFGNMIQNWGETAFGKVSEYAETKIDEIFNDVSGNGTGAPAGVVETVSIDPVATQKPTGEAMFSKLKIPDEALYIGGAILLAIAVKKMM